MSLSTSIYIDNDLLKKLIIYSKSAKIPMNNLISQILLKAAAHYKCNYREHRLIEYQKNTGAQHFVPYHLRFSQDENEKFQAARYILKISVSKMLFLGFLLFIEEILKKLQKGATLQNKFYYSYHKFIKKFSFLIENFNISLKKRE